MQTVLAALLLLVQSPDLGPTLPPRTTPFLNEISHQVQVLLSQSKFQEAAAELAKWHTGEIGYEFEGELPPEFSSCPQEAAAIWKEVSGDRITFKPKKDAFVRFRVAKQLDGMGDAEYVNGKVIAPLPLIVGQNGSPTSKYTATWIMAKAFGFALGIGSTTRRNHLTGMIMFVPDTVSNARLTADIAERSMLLRILEARETLAKAIADKRVLTPGGPKFSVDVTHIDGGIVQQGDKARFTVKITNSGNVPLRTDFESGCSCVAINPPQQIAAGATQALTFELDTKEFVGKVEKTIDIYTNDAQNPHQVVRIVALSLPVFRVLPDGMPTIPLKDEGDTEYDLIVYGTDDNRPLKIANVQLSKLNFPYKILPFDGEVTDPLIGDKPMKRQGSILRITIPESQPAGVDWIRAIIVTDAQAKVYADKTLQLVKGMYAIPKGVYFSSLKQNASDTRMTIVSHPTTKFKITGYESETPGITAKWEPEGDTGRSYRVTITASKQKPGPLNTRIFITTDHPKYPRIALPVSGNVE